jgi:regulatory protein
VRATKEKKKKPVTEAYLERAALHYLERFSSTEANLCRVLERKVRRRLEGESPTREHISWIEACAAKCVKLGYVDDGRYAIVRFESLLRKGKPLRTIGQDLRYKGVSQELVAEILSAAREDEDKDPDLQAAAAYVRRRRFGPFRRPDRMTDDKIEKEKAAMMRAGFSYQLVKRVMEATEDELVSLLP